ncbi:extracellular solute-binding protein [Cohnella silvisoli]|uniref:Extracellular solute-binding protein n=1 Tax=Cohnella silvisoli TaxID=2873699 RepID=A0ABV1L0A0_9BACL|nr:extracellular solute-binding protein [Cohnella silvisoli]MCD9025133.1 extracellular solute-binding protein [Cohnella silvisoli]
MSKRFKQWITTATAISMLVAVLVACSSGGGAKQGASSSSPPTTSPAPSESQATATPPEEKIELSMFYSDSGLAVDPPDTDLSDNPYINIVEEKANVDLKVEVPPYSDFPTKFNLMLASGKLPDIVHTYMPAEAYKAAREGAFIDLKPYYDKSPIIQKYITPQMMELAKDPISGKYWRIPMALDKGPQGAGIYTRYDLVEKYNDGKWPESVEEWVELMRKIKKAEPNSIPMSTRAIGDYVFIYGGAVIFQMYGAAPYGYRIQGGKVIPNVVLPEYRAAVETMRQMYKEGLLDKEFATTDSEKWFTKWNNNNVLFQWNYADQLLAGAAYYRTQGTDQQKTQKFEFAPPLKESPTDPKYTVGAQAIPISDHGLYISSSSKDKDRAWKVIEAFASDELREAIFWGKENETYTVKDDKRLPIADKMGAKERTWLKSLAFIFGFTDGQDAQVAVNEQLIGDSTYFNEVQNSIKMLGEQAANVGLGAPIGYVEPEVVAKKGPEIMQAINKFTVKAIMGRISMDQFDKEVKAWEQKYRAFKYDPLQKFIDENKDQQIALGYKMAGW